MWNAALKPVTEITETKEWENNNENLKIYGENICTNVDWVLDRNGNKIPNPDLYWHGR